MTSHSPGTNERLHRTDPATHAPPASLYAKHAATIRELVTTERLVLDQMARLSSNTRVEPIDRTEALMARRSEVEMFTSRNRERDRKAKRLLMVAAATFTLIPALELLKPHDLYLAANQGTEWLAGFNGSFIAFIGLLSLIFLLCAQALRLIFAPWFSGHLKHPHPDAISQPQVAVVSRPVWRIRQRRLFGTALSVPVPTRYYRTLPVTNADLLAAALEHLHATELAHQNQRR